MTFLDQFSSLSVPLFDHWGYWIVLFAALLEAVPVFGIFIPGQSIVIAAGFLTRLEVLRITDVIVLASIGVIIGDTMGYLLGRKFGRPLILKCGKYFFLKESHYDRVKKLMNEHTAKTLIIGRFNSLTRALAPFVAGSTHIPFRKFFVINVIGGISWAITFVFIGHIFGEGYRTASKYIGKYTFYAFVIAIVIIFAYKKIKGHGPIKDGR